METSPRLRSVHTASGAPEAEAAEAASCLLDGMPRALRGGADESLRLAAVRSWLFPQLSARTSACAVQALFARHALAAFMRGALLLDDDATIPERFPEVRSSWSPAVMLDQAPMRGCQYSTTTQVAHPASWGSRRVNATSTRTLNALARQNGIQMLVLSLGVCAKRCCVSHSARLL